MGILAHAIGVQTVTINTTGADLLLVMAGSDPSTTLSDSVGGFSNIFTLRESIAFGISNSNKTYLWECPVPANTGASHSFTLSIAYGAIAAWAVSGVNAFDAGNASGSASTAVSILQPGSITPTVNGEFLLSAFVGNSDPSAIDSGFTLEDILANISGIHYGLNTAFLVQTTAAAINPTWTIPTAASAGAIIAAYRLLSLSSCSVPADGSNIALTFNGTVTLTTANLTATINGEPVYISAVSGSGTAWTASIGQRWIRSTDVVVVKYLTGTPVTATNSSTVTDQQVRYVGRKFGMFIHFNMATFNNEEQATGTELINSFAPSTDIALAIDQWIVGAKYAGMKYMVLTVTHADGFALWPTAQLVRNIAGTSWYGANGNPDIVYLFAQKVRAAGIGVGFYYNPWNLWWQNNNPGWTNTQLQNLVTGQLTELLSNYGPIDLVWFDQWAWAASPSTSLSYTQLPYSLVNSLVKTLQPNCQMLVNNHEHTFAHTDINGYEFPYEGAPPANNTVPCECCDTIRGDSNWFWKAVNDTTQSYATLSGRLSGLNSNRSGYLLNCPPSTTGRLPAATMSMLSQLGSANLEAVLGKSYAPANGAAKTVSVTLTTDGTTAAASLSGLKWAFWDSAAPQYQSAPLVQGTGGSTNASGVFVAKVATALSSGSTGWLVVTDSDGTTTQSPSHKEFSGPVTVT